MINVINGQLWQWDTGRQVEIKLSDNITLKEVHFSNNTTPNALVVKPKENIVDIPNILLQSHANLTVYAMITNEAGEQTKESAVLGVNKRPKPDDYVYTETEIKSIEKVVENALKEAQESGAFDGDKGEPGDDYILTDADKTEIAKKIVSHTATLENEALSLKTQFIVPPKVTFDNDVLHLEETVIKAETEILDDVLVLR